MEHLLVIIAGASVRQSAQVADKDIVISTKHATPRTTFGFAVTRVACYGKMVRIFIRERSWIWRELVSEHHYRAIDIRISTAELDDTP